MDCAPSATARRPDPQTMLTVTALTSGGKPPKIAAWRAGFCPSPADTTLPMMHSSICSGWRCARCTASRTTTAPRRGGGDIGERTLKLPHRRTHAGDNHNLVHFIPLTNLMREPAFRIQRKITESRDTMHDVPTETTPLPQSRAGRTGGSMVARRADRAAAVGRIGVEQREQRTATHWARTMLSVISLGYAPSGGFCCLSGGGSA